VSPQALHRELLYEGAHVDSISGGQPNSMRAAAVDRFRAGKTRALIATDLLARGACACGVCVCVC
jgi:ATP-dependent RNA helicase DDX52/ROK1